MTTKRFSDLELAHQPERVVCAAALTELMETVPACSAGLILTGADVARFEVVASHGLGAEPLRTLQAVPGGIALLAAAAQQACLVTLGGDQIDWEPGSSKAPIPSARARQARARLAAGMASPFTRGGAVVGLIALYGGRRLDGIEQRSVLLEATQALGQALGAAVGNDNQREETQE